MTTCETHDFDAIVIGAGIAGLLSDSLPCRVGGDTGEIDPPGIELDEEQHMESSEQHSVNSEEVAGQHRRGLHSQKLCPGRPRSTRRGLDAMPAKDLPHARWSEPDTHGCQLPLDPPIAPERVLSCQTKDQRDCARWNRRSSRPFFPTTPCR